MWRIPLAFILLIVILFIGQRISDHFAVAQEGGIRKNTIAFLALSIL